MSASPHPRPLTVLLGCDTFSPDINGAARFAERLAAGLVRRGHAVHVSAPSQQYRRTPARTERIEGEDLTMHRLPSVPLPWHEWLRFVWPWRSKHYARRVLDSVRPDVVHIQSHIVIGRGLTREARKRGIPVIATNHTMAENVLDSTRLPDWANRRLVRAAWADARRTFEMCATVTTPTRKAADFLEGTINVAGVVPVSCGIDMSQYTADLSPRPDNRIVFVGRLTAEKRVEDIIRAAARLDPALDVHVDLVGDGDQRQALAELAEQFGLGDRVTFHGHVSDEELRATLTRASVFAIASIAELQSIATMEAMASGLPIVAADAVALPHLVSHGENGYLFEPGNVGDLAEHLRTVLTARSEDRERMQRASLSLVAVHDFDRTVDVFEALYRGEPLPV
ncbi:glycosyltransferase [Microbacterium amylolyticum]|uniref:D-inositol 3-phosphate glycosyltransferase n=1 Tax=Microbacterium amylolyticum TaxID=936337 RepID=A0ABS4ZHP2_9MICO|nr:glycosyltransferase [Microbacterium amylolyticum]MBP2436797.1 glycosyltransferase involved in cell wall biosynthesis [Microbacterium amylolyticum]